MARTSQPIAPCPCIFSRHELPKLATAALEATPDGMSTVQVAARVIAAKVLDTTDKRIRKAVIYKLMQLLRQCEKKRKVKRVGKVGAAVVWRLPPLLEGKQLISEGSEIVCRHLS